MIRKVNPETDAAAIASIYKKYVCETTISFEVDPLSAPQMKERIIDIASDYPYYVWTRPDGSVGGYCYAHPWKERSAYNPTLETTIYLADDCRGHGIGRQLMEQLIADCREQGYVSLIACITADNLSSCRFHESLGFRQVSLFISVGRKFGCLLDVVDYQLML